MVCFPPMAHSASLEDDKDGLRRAALARRDALPVEHRRAAAEAIAARPLPVAAGPHGLIVSGYLPIRSECDPQPLMRRLIGAGALLALPCMAGRGEPLVMRAWRFGDPLVACRWGLCEPPADAPEVLPDILLVPLAAFDRAGHRVGYGAGYYDMTITRLRGLKPITAIGIAYAMQEVPSVPASERDARLDLVVTESEAIDLRG
jgi:5-formyltetrahydrofolate cyclo-ligase